MGIMSVTELENLLQLLKRYDDIYCYDIRSEKYLITMDMIEEVERDLSRKHKGDSYD